MKRYIIAGNLKMNLDLPEITQYFLTLTQLLKDTKYPDITQIVCPVFPLLPTAMQGTTQTDVKIGAQNVSEHDKGAYTGEVSAPILASLKVPYCIIGHSERRQYFHETDELIKQKWLKLRENKINPIICIGETLSERESGQTLDVIKRQITDIFSGTPLQKDEDMMIAYEPVWAIGTGRTATPEIAQEVHLYIRQLLLKHYAENAHNIPLLYGGSVKPANIKELLSMPDINGALIGGASLIATDFAQMIKTAQETLDNA